jgi:hypothetical protein
MLTIKIIDQDGIEIVKEVKSVMKRPGRETTTGKDYIKIGRAHV